MVRTHSRLVSTQESYPWIGTGIKIFFVLKSLVPTQSSQDKEIFYCPFQSTDNFPEWKLALSEYAENCYTVYFKY